MSEHLFLGASALAILTVIAAIITAFIREPMAMLMTIALLALVKPFGHLIERGFDAVD
jgi:hypothetical protein